MNFTGIKAQRAGQWFALALAGSALFLAAASSARAQNLLMNCADSPQQDPAKILRSGIWKQWIYWITPGPDSYRAIQRVVAEVNQARSVAGLPWLIADPTSPLIVSVFDESNPRGENGSSTLLSNQEVFLATFVENASGGSQVLFLTDAIRSNDVLTTVKLVPGITGTIERSIKLDLDENGNKVDTDWHVTSSVGDEIRFSASYLDAAVSNRNISPASRIVFANCNLASFSDLVYRSSPTITYTLFDRSQGSFVDLAHKDVKVHLTMKHHDRDIDEMFNDPQNVPQLLIETDRVVRIESK